MTDVTVTRTRGAADRRDPRRRAAGAMLRVSVEGGGCSGFQYKFDIERSQADDDLVIERDGAIVLIDPVSLQLHGRRRDRFRRRPDRRVVQDRQPERDRLLRLRHQLHDLIGSLMAGLRPGHPAKHGATVPLESRSPGRPSRSLWRSLAGDNGRLRLAVAPTPPRSGAAPRRAALRRAAARGCASGAGRCGRDRDRSPA